MKKPIALFFYFWAFLFTAGRGVADSTLLGQSGRVPAATAERGGPLQSGSGSVQDEDKGIGPIEDLKLGPIDHNLAQEGASIFQSKCSTCHSLDSRKVGPPLGNVLDGNTPEFIMNFILNTTEMIEKNDKIKKLVQKYGMKMPDLGLKKDQARAVLEYLRTTGQHSDLEFH
jgi:cytochrome c2